MSSSSPCDEAHEGGFPPLPSRHVRLFLLRPEKVGPDWRGLYESWLSPAEHLRLRGFRFEQSRLEFLHGRALTRYVLSRYLRVPPRALRFDFNAHGKPTLPAASGLHFNLSHSKGVCVLAVSGMGPIGVDLERVDAARSRDEISAHYFTPDEHRHVMDHEPSWRSMAFFAIWTLKESFIKAVGMGLSMPLSSFSMRLDHKRLSLHVDPGTPCPAHWHGELRRVAPDLLLAWSLDAQEGCVPEVSLHELVPGQLCHVLDVDVLARSW